MNGVHLDYLFSKNINFHRVWKPNKHLSVKKYF